MRPRTPSPSGVPALALLLALAPPGCSLARLAPRIVRWGCAPDPSPSGELALAPPGCSLARLAPQVFRWGCAPAPSSSGGLALAPPGCSLARLAPQLGQRPPSASRVLSASTNAA